MSPEDSGYCLCQQVTETKDRLSDIWILTVSGPQATVCSGEDDPPVGALHIYTYNRHRVTHRLQNPYITVTCKSPEPVFKFKYNQFLIF